MAARALSRQCTQTRGSKTLLKKFQGHAEGFKLSVRLLLELSAETARRAAGKVSEVISRVHESADKKASEISQGALNRDSQPGFRASQSGS